MSQGELNKFKDDIKSVSQKALDYSRLLRDLDHYRLTITINAENYKRELRDISGKLPQDDLSFLETFFNDCRLFQEQIQSDLGYFGNGAALLEQALSAIRARVDIDQAEREKRLERWIALVGTGLAVSGISSQTAGKPLESIIDPKQSLDCPKTGVTPCLTYSVVFVLFHVAVGAIAAFILNGIINLVSKRE
ncbi:hypothetical protein BJP36_18030 [Moorena producens JHB]|uniref:Uncharacterized protein n=1 Tax=Moorena producens (strain JHB) TaxID=1454205 RepID=A0A1D9G1N4_MOOP1|nr:hypothetical protein [Moorena producens]AOY81527.1 hypothetical protein BJP36_18030 [Moorena producens JHB]